MLEYNFDDFTPSPTTTVAALLLPGIRQALFRYGSMREVEVYASPFTESLIVKYTLITDESRRVEIPLQLWLDDDYTEILRRITEHLGRLS